MSTMEGASCWMQLVAKLPCVPSREPARTWCLTCSGLLFGVGTFTAIMLAIWRALFPPLPPIVPGSPGGQGPTIVTRQNGVLNIKTDVGLALGGVAVVLIFMIVFYVVGLWVNRRPQRLLRAAMKRTDSCIGHAQNTAYSKIKQWQIQKKLDFFSGFLAVPSIHTTFELAAGGRREAC